MSNQLAKKWTAKDSRPLTLLDGGVGRTLCANGLPTEEGSLFRKIWSAAALAEPKHHEIVIKTHIEFIKSGSQVITTNSYATQPNYYMSAYEKDDYMKIMCEHAKIAAELAQTARKRCEMDGKIKIFGVLGPIGESHQPGVTKTFVESHGRQNCVEAYSKLAEALHEGGIDGFLLETMNYWDEALIALEGLELFLRKLTYQSLPIMLSMEAALRKDNVQPDPKGLGPIYRQNFLTYLKKNPHMNITAFGLNCAAPEDLIASLHGMFDKKTKDDVDLEDELIKQNIGFCVYANLNERAYHNESQGYDRSKDDPNKILRDEKMTFDGHIGYINAIEHILKNFKAVTHIGGCCGTLPDGISSLRARFF